MPPPVDPPNPPGEPPVGLPGPDTVRGMNYESETFQHYQVLRRPDGSLWELGRGAMGVTYKAFDTNLRCHVALKVISAAHLHSEVIGQRFIREARVAAQVRHRNIAAVYHLGIDPQGFFYSMEFIDGETLEDLVHRVGPLPLETVLRIALQAARALAAASRQGLIHRDIKPANLMVLHKDEDGEDRMHIKVIDFGLARSYDPENSNAQLTATGFVGTPLYSSPEQLEEKDLDVRSDIYSLGVTLWILLTGRPPFEGKMTQVITQHLHADPPWHDLSGLPTPARALLETMLRKDPAERFQTATELRQAVEACLRGLTGKDDPDADASEAGESAALAGRADAYATHAPGAAPTLAQPPGEVEDGPRRNLRPLAGVGAVPFARTRGARLFWRRVSVWQAALVGVLVVGFVALLIVFSRGGNHRQAKAGAAESAVAKAVPVPPPTVPVVGVSAVDRPVLLTAAATRASGANPANDASSLATNASQSLGPTREGPSATMSGKPPESDGVALLTRDTLAAGAETPPGPPVSPSPTEPTPTPLVAAVIPSPTPTASADGDDDDDTQNATAKSEKTASHSTRSTRRRRATPTPTPNIFQRIFGIKPKPKPKSK